MEEEVKKKKNKVSSSSNVRKKNVDISSDELLEQIMNKKKIKKESKSTKKLKADSNKKVATEDLSLNEKKSVNNKSSSKKTVSKTSSTRSTKSSSKKKSIKNELSDDELLSSIVDKKKSKTAKRKAKSLVTKESSSIEINELKELDKQLVEKDFQDNFNEKDKSVKKPKVAKENLIITREINFDYDKLDLNNKKVLAELKDAIEKFDKLEDLEEINSSLDLINDDIGISKDNVPDSVFVKRSDKYDDDYLLESITNVSEKKKVGDRVKYDNNEGQRFLLFIICIVLFSILIYIFYNFVFKVSFSDNNNSNVIENNDQKDNQEEVDLKSQMYEDCLNRENDYRDLTEKYNIAVEDLNNYLKDNYKVSVAYQDLEIGFEYSYNSDVSYYAASTIKTLDALYIYEKAANGEIDLNSTLVYTSKYGRGHNLGLATYKSGSKVSIRDLVRFAIVYSDNAAHQMLVEYIGRSNLKSFGQELGAIYTLNGFDNFGNINSNDAVIYMLALNEFINNNVDLGKELQSFFLAAEQNDLAIPEEGIEAAHKYGQYQQYYHDIGIVYDEHPYIAVVLTLEGKSNFEEKVKDISKHIYDLHKIFYENRKEICNNEVYGI